MADENSNLTNQFESNDVIAVSRLLQHLRNPQNLLGYMIFTAWMKFMDMTQYIPSITIG